LSKKETIIQAAMKLFAEKGYHATSMQEIAEQSGMAKGSLYNYFKSKEEIALSIFRYHYEMLFQKLEQVANDATLSAREKFEKQLMLQIEEFVRRKELVGMHMGEQAAKINDEVHQLVFRIRAQTINWYRQAIIDMYGESVRPFALDCATMLNGIMKEYMFYMAIEKKELRYSSLAPFMLRRLDAMVASFTTNDAPLLTDELMQDYLNVEQHEKENDRRKIVAYLEEILQELQQDKLVKRDVIHSLKTLKEEFLQPENAREFMAEALLMYLEKQRLPHWEEVAAAIRRYFA